MTVYVGSTYKCPGSVADIMPAVPPDAENGIRDGQVVAWLMADTPLELRQFAVDKLGLPGNRRLGLGAMMRYVISGWERNRALALGAEVRTFAPTVAR